MMHSDLKAKKSKKMLRHKVLILVLMDDALWQQNTGFALFKGILRLFCAS